MNFLAPAEQLCISTPLIKLCTKWNFFHVLALIVSHDAFRDCMSGLKNSLADEAAFVVAAQGNLGNILQKRRQQSQRMKNNYSSHAKSDTHEYH